MSYPLIVARQFLLLESYCSLLALCLISCQGKVGGGDRINWEKIIYKGFCFRNQCLDTCQFHMHLLLLELQNVPITFNICHLERSTKIDDYNKFGDFFLNRATCGFFLGLMVWLCQCLFYKLPHQGALWHNRKRPLKRRALKF